MVKATLVSSKLSKNMKTKKITNPLLTPIDFFKWSTPAPKVKPKDRPENVLDKKPNDHDAKSLQDLVTEFTDGPVGKLALKNVKGKQVSYLNLPKYEEIPLRELMSALAVQRPANYKHVKNILVDYDEKKVQYVNVLRIKVGKTFVYYIIDGQHTAITYGVWAKWGYFAPEVKPENWLDVKVKCQVVQHDNFTFAREHFLGINGDDKLKLAHFDKWKNYVLSKRQDSPNKTTLDKYEDAFSQQVILESYGIIPIHEKDEVNKDKPGAFNRTDLLKDVSEEELHWFCAIHQMNFDDRPVDSFEVLPVINLRHKIKGAKSLTNKPIEEFVVSLGNIIKNVAGSPAKFRTLTESTYKEWFKNAYPGEKIPSQPPADASLALLLYIYYEHGGTFTSVSKMFMDDYNEQGYTLFNALDQNLQDMIKP
jgi:hypothetical protein